MRGDRPQRLLDKLYSPVKTVHYTPPVVDPIQSTLQTTSTYPSNHLNLPFKPPQYTLQTTSVYPSNHLDLPFKPPQPTLQTTSIYPSSHLNLPFKPPQYTLQTTSIYPSNHLNLPFKPPQSTLQATSTYPSNHLSLPFKPPQSIYCSWSSDFEFSTSGYCGWPYCLSCVLSVCKGLLQECIVMFHSFMLLTPGTLSTL